MLFKAFTMTVMYSLSFLNPFKLPDQICHSPYCQQHNFNLCLYREFSIGSTNYPQIDIFFILITYLVDIELIL